MHWDFDLESCPLSVHPYQRYVTCLLITFVRYQAWNVEEMLQQERQRSLQKEGAIYYP